MKEKLTLQDIVDLLAKRTSLSKKEADVFFREFFALIIDNVFNNEPVKIKELGTFKLTKVNSRESIDVNTGEKIEIPAHYKISFLPDKSLKALVNKPFANFETTLLEDGVTFDSIEESEEPIETSEIEDTAVDETEIKFQSFQSLEPVRKQEKTDIEEEKPIAQTKSRTDEKQTATENLSELKDNAAEKETPIINYSYVYSYGTDTKDEESVTTIYISPENIAAAPPKEEASIEKEKTVAQTINAEEIILKEVFGDDDETENTVPPIEINKVQEKIDQLKEAIEALTKSSGTITLQNETISSEAVENIGTSPKEIKEKPIENKKITGDEVDEFKNLSWDNTERVSYKSFENIDEKDAAVSSSPHTHIEAIGENKTDTDFENDYEFHDYYKETAFSRFRKKIPLIILLVGLLAFGGYQFYKLFDIKHNYEYYRGFRDYFAKDSVSIEIDTNDSILSLTDSTEPAIPLPADGTFVDESAVHTETRTELEQAQENAEKDIVSTEKYDKVISENLKIKVAKKAEYIQNKEIDSESPVNVQQKQPTPSVTNRQMNRPTSETVKAGSTLRNIAAKHYGNSSFWVYIYEENKSNLPDYDNLTIGMVLKLPNATKYGIDPQNSESIRKAKLLEQDIFNSTRGYRR